ncbi:hypothetical protein [Burkholderia vietnamiensis]|uniref:hypothetical protein n=1 Tax=Burkholderia vietnamiensis TaxID=60552 RepID=UPI000AD5B51E|nr:hypothetical protein [Burkholderia vietnamiensis]MBR8003173.1 hypothetical protein [Burkholderia vietnamiensis]MBR8050452.1 hypothetical protein [Burkholderia vietnamiensis]MCA8071122.1 hypothetical protein [Burkholderia vietnamiensis]MCA8182670.1 hypothetical protein [Burkholderia vietnamiensis]UEC03768.1 hypothetical protein LK462_31240 [Burkholderia vietnamiensis]
MAYQGLRKIVDVDGSEFVNAGLLQERLGEGWLEWMTMLARQRHDARFEVQTNSGDP